jgi:hypothetical protein
MSEECCFDASAALEICATLRNTRSSSTSSGHVITPMVSHPEGRPGKITVRKGVVYIAKRFDRWILLESDTYAGRDRIAQRACELAGEALLD